MLSRRQTLKAVSVAGGLGAIGGRAVAQSENENGEQDSNADGSTETEETAVRIAHFSPDAPNVDVYIDDEEVFSNISYETVSDYHEIEAGIHQIRITAAGDPETVIVEDETSLSQAFFTVAVLGELDQETIQLNILPDANSSLLRLVHGTPDAPALNIRKECTGRTYFENISFEEQTDYIVFPAGSCTLDVFPADTDRDAADDQDDEPLGTLDIDLEQGMAYTVFVTGYIEDDPSLTMTLIEDGAVSVDEIE